jgi:hypothetical protein
MNAHGHGLLRIRDVSSRQHDVLPQMMTDAIDSTLDTDELEDETEAEVDKVNMWAVLAA